MNRNLKTAATMGTAGTGAHVAGGVGGGDAGRCLTGRTVCSKGYFWAE